MFILTIYYAILTNIIVSSDSILKQERVIKKSSILLSELVSDLDSIFDSDNQILSYYYNIAHEVNKDTIGWIQCQEFNIDYPVLYSIESNKYLRHNLYGEWDIRGSIYLDSYYNGSTTLPIIHGHNMLDNSMFSMLPNMLEYKSLDNVSSFYFFDGTATKEYKVFSVFVIDTSSTTLNFEPLLTLNELKKQQEYLKSKSVVPFSREVTGLDTLILNTCWYGDSGKEHNLHCIVVLCRV